MEVAKRYQDNLERIKTTIRRAHDGFKPNYDRYNEYKRFVFDTSLDSAEITLLMTLSRPQLEFNVLEAYISRLLGEFSKQEPDIEVSSDDHSKTDPMMLKIVEEHLRHVLTDSKNHHTRYEVYKDLLAGGFSVIKVYTDYDNPMSMKQEICIERVFDPTLCGFDLLSKYSHKGDGRFCFELYPKSKEDFEEEFPDVKIDALSFRRDLAGFNWSYLNDTGKMLIVCDYYEKKKKETKIVQLVDGSVKKWDDYKKMLDEWGDLSAPPAVVGKPRKTTIEQICRYRLIENQVLEYVETDFNHLPLVFVDGNSVMIKTPKNSNIRQVTRPYVYHAKGAQRLKNFAGIALANEIENTVQHKFMVAKEALPKEEDFLMAYKDVQKASVLVYNSNHENNPDLPIANPIREIHRDPAPPEMVQAFNGSDSLIQNILGSYDASLGINNNQLSGIAIVEAASQSNSAAMPYIVGFLQGFQRAAQVYVDLMPKYYTTPRTIPIVDNEGMRNYVKINQEDGVDMESFDTNSLNVVVKAGASFQVQKARTINMVKELMGMSPLIQEFIGEKGISFVLDNMEGKGIEQLKSMVEEWIQELEQRKAMAQQAQQQEAMNNPAIMKAQNDRMKLQLDAQKAQSQVAVDMSKLQTAQQKMLADIQLSKESNMVQVLKANTERFAKQVDYALKHKDMGHRHLREAIETHHKVKSQRQEKHG